MRNKRRNNSLIPQIRFYFQLQPLLNRCIKEIGDPPAIYFWDPDGEIENSGKSIFEIRIPNFYYIQDIVFDLSYLPVATIGTTKVRYYEKIVKNIKRVFHIFCNRSSGFGFQKCFSRKFQLHRRDPIESKFG